MDSFLRENDFLLMMPKASELDINDPRNEHLLCALLAAGDPSHPLAPPRPSTLSLHCIH